MNYFHAGIGDFVTGDGMPTATPIMALAPFADIFGCFDFKSDSASVARWLVDEVRITLLASIASEKIFETRPLKLLPWIKSLRGRPTSVSMFLFSLYPGCIGESMELPKTDASNTRQSRNNAKDTTQLSLFTQ